MGLSLGGIAAPVNPLTQGWVGNESLTGVGTIVKTATLPQSLTATDVLQIEINYDITHAASNPVSYAVDLYDGAWKSAFSWSHSTPSVAGFVTIYAKNGFQKSELTALTTTAITMSSVTQVRVTVTGAASETVKLNCISIIRLVGSGVA